MEKKDPIKQKPKQLTNEQIKCINQNIVNEIKEAFDFAKTSPFPSKDTAARDVYAG